MKWLMTGLFLASTVQAASRSPGDRPPNVVLIMTDDQGYGDFSNMDHPYLKTPNLDRLRSESVSFENFLVAPVCAPTRAGLLTGRYTYRTGTHDTYQSRVNMWPDEKTIAEYLKDAGYATGLFGKWHLGYNYPLRACDQGFDTYITWQEMQHSRQFPLMEEDGRFVFYPEFMSNVFCDKASEFIRKNKERPFFCYYPLFLPHTHPDNLQVLEKYVERFRQFDELTEGSREIFGMIEMADELIGRLLGTLDREGLRDNTIIIFLSDNGAVPRRYRDGTPEPNAGFRGHKNQVYEGGIRSPFYVRWPSRLPAGTTVKQMGSYIDILPTILDLCGVLPDKWEKPLDGLSLVPLLTGAAEPWPDRSFFMHFIRGGPEQIRAAKWENGCVRTDRWKLVNGKELYDLESDRNESDNLAQQHLARVAEMRAAYEAWFRDVTGERNLTAAPNAVGSPEQPMTFLYFFEKDQEVKPAGWPVDVVSRGPYTVCIENVQHEMFREGSECVLRCGGLVLRKKVDPKLADLVFEGVDLPAGRHTLQIDFEGDIAQKKWRYNLADLGHRLVWVRKELHHDDRGHGQPTGGFDGGEIR